MEPGEKLEVVAPRELLEVVLPVGNVAEQRLDRRPFETNLHAVHPDPPRGGLALADQHAQGRTLAGAVGAEQTEQLTLAQLEVQAIDGHEVAVSNHELVQVQDRSGHGVPPRGGSLPGSCPAGWGLDKCRSHPSSRRRALALVGYPLARSFGGEKCRSVRDLSDRQDPAASARLVEVGWAVSCRWARSRRN